MLGPVQDPRVKSPSSQLPSAGVEERSGSASGLTMGSPSVTFSAGKNGRSYVSARSPRPWLYQPVVLLSIMIVADAAPAKRVIAVAATN